MNISPEPRSQCDPTNKGCIGSFYALFPINQGGSVMKTNDAKRYEVDKKSVVNRGMSYTEYEKAIKEMCAKGKY